MTFAFLIAFARLGLIQDLKAQGPAPSAQVPLKPPPVPTGVVPLPQGSPPTGPQAPVPSPIAPLPTPSESLRISPDLRSVQAYVGDRAITLPEAIAVALYTSRDFALAAAGLQQAEGQAGEARTALYPTVSANGDLVYYDKATVADLGALGGAGTGTTGGTGSSAATPPLIITPQFNPVFTGSFAIPLDIFGSLRAAASQAQFNAVAARLDVNRVRNDVVYNVKSAFYDVLRAQAQVDVATDSLNNALTRLNDANRSYGAGVTPRFDVISAQRDVANAQQDLINAQAQLSVDFATLKNTIGLSPKSRLRISDAGAVETPPGVLPPFIPETATRLPNTSDNPVKPPVLTPPIETAPPVAVPTIPPVTSPITRVAGIAEDTFDFGPEFDGLVREAVQTRPDLLEEDARIAAARRGVQYARRSQLPSFNFSVGGTYTPQATGFTRSHVGMLELGITLPIYDGGLGRERVREARGVEASARVNRRTQEDQVQLDLQRAYIALVQARSRVAVANVGLAQAREAFRLARARYNAGISQQVGVSPQVELSNAQTTLAQAENNGVNALYDYNVARAQLDHAVGRFSFTGAAPGYPAPPPDKVRGVKD